VAVQSYLVNWHNDLHTGKLKLEMLFLVRILYCVKSVENDKMWLHKAGLNLLYYAIISVQGC
jgi:hypothetical protein